MSTKPTKLSSILPLPFLRGEGRGEGEESTRLMQIFSRISRISRLKNLGSFRGMTTDGHGYAVGAGRPQLMWTGLSPRPAPNPCPSVFIQRLLQKITKVTRDRAYSVCLPLDAHGRPILRTGLRLQPAAFISSFPSAENIAQLRAFS